MDCVSAKTPPPTDRRQFPWEWGHFFTTIYNHSFCCPNNIWRGTAWRSSVNYEGFRQYNVAKSILQNPFPPLFECAWLFGAPGDVNILESYLTSSLLVVELLKSGSRVGPYPLTLFPLQSPDTRRIGRRVLLSAPQGGFLQNSY